MAWLITGLITGAFIVMLVGSRFIAVGAGAKEVGAGRVGAGATGVAVGLGAGEEVRMMVRSAAIKYFLFFLVFNFFHDQST
jgi:hypothetical protein